jgi:hypothetical protein
VDFKKVGDRAIAESIEVRAQSFATVLACGPGGAAREK